MQALTTPMTADDGTTVVVHSWLPDGVAPLGGPEAGGAMPRGVIQVAHGMAEHAGRYERFAAAAVEAGYAVHADDHRGHGLTIAAPADRGFLADKDGWSEVVGDLATLLRLEQRTYPGVPVVLLGHSWGSFLARDLATRQGADLAALVLTGTGGNPGLAGRAGYALASAECRLKGPRHPSVALDQLVFGSYNRGFHPQRTAFDWLSRDEAEVDRYLADPLCGFTCTAGFFRDLIAGTFLVSSPRRFRRTPQDLPVHLYSGAMDPVGAQGRGVRQVATQYRRAGVREVGMTLYPGARHEVLNETNREQVTVDILAWIGAHT